MDLYPKSCVEIVQFATENYSDELLCGKNGGEISEWGVSVYYGRGGVAMLTVTVFVADALCPTPSLTVIVTVYVPGSM